MAHFLYRVGRNAYAYKWRFLAAWLFMILTVGIGAATLTQPTSTNFTIPGLQSVETMEKLQEEFPDSDADINVPAGQLVIQAPEGQTLAEGEAANDLTTLLQALKEKPYLANSDQLVSPVLAAGALQQQMPEASPEDLAAISPLSPDGRTGIIQLAFKADTAIDVSAEDRADFAATVKNHAGDLTIGWGGNAFQSSEVDSTAEIIGMAVAAIVLIATFGSFVAAGLPLISAITGVALGIGLVFTATSFTDNINSMTPTLASMIGLAVGIDYALFILARFRSELIRQVNGYELPPKELAAQFRTLSPAVRAHLMGRAVGTAGSAVVFAGLTVLIALAALSVINIPFLTAMALAAAGTVALAVLVALTLLPAIVGLIGTRVFAGRAPLVKAPDPESETPTMGLRWVRRIRRRPTLVAGASAMLLILLAIPAAQLRLAMPTDAMMSLGSPNRTAYELIDESFGPGRNAPIIALTNTTDPQEIQRDIADITAVEGVNHAQVVGMSDSATQLLITPEYSPTDERSAELLQSLRDNTNVEVTGQTPMFEDISQRLQDALIPYLSIVLTLAFVLLMIVFRSIWVPLIAALGFGLSVAATFGVTVALWQNGALGIIDDPQPLISFLPIMLIGLVFGLAMDYQVFLVTRMREGWVHGKTAGNATANGFKHGARVVTAAALIMISVFSAFMLLDEPFIKVMGFALATAVFFDAFVVRMTFIPATMFLLDERAWSIPRWLNKILPSIDIEGENLAVDTPSTTANLISADDATTSTTSAANATSTSTTGSSDNTKDATDDNNTAGTH